MYNYICIVIYVFKFIVFLQNNNINNETLSTFCNSNCSTIVNRFFEQHCSLSFSEFSKLLVFYTCIYKKYDLNYSFCAVCSQNEDETRYCLDFEYIVEIGTNLTPVRNDDCVNTNCMVSSVCNASVQSVS